MNLATKTMIVIIIPMIICQFGCVSHKTGDNVSDETVIKVGNVNISKYEFELSRDKFKRNNKTNTPVAMQKWVDDFIGQVYILADAYSKKYDTISEIKDQMAEISMYRIGMVDGLLWNKVVEPQLKFSTAELKATYKKRDKVYYIDYIKFADKQNMVAVLKGDTVLDNEKAFNEAIPAVKASKNNRYANYPMLWPFYKLEPYKETIIKLNQGEISRPIYTADGVYIIHLIKAEKINPKPFKEEKNNIEWELKNIRKQKITKETQREVYAKANIIINDTLLEDVLTFIKNCKNEKFDFPNLPMKNNNSVLMTYTLNKKREKFTVHDFINFYKYSQVRPPIKKAAFSQFTRDFVDFQYMLAQADSVGITHDKKFLLEQQSSLNRLILSYYIQNEISKTIKISNEELVDYYQKNKTSFIQGKSCTISLFNFKDMKSAGDSWQYINSQIQNGDFGNLTDTAYVKGLISYKPGIKIDANDKTYSRMLTSTIFGLNDRALSFPIETDGSVYFFYKIKEEGTIIQPFENVKDIIEYQLKYHKTDQLVKARIQELKGKYQMTINKIKKLNL